MVFNDPTTKQGIVQDALAEASANSVTYPIADLTRDANTALDIAVDLIQEVDGEWQYDSANATDIPISTTAINSGQSAYTLESDTKKLSNLAVSDATGLFRDLIQIDHYDDSSISRSEFAKQTGTPEYYDLIGKSVILYPTPDYTILPTDDPEGGLRGYFQRDIDYFASNDTIKEPGFTRSLHKFVSLYCAYVYASKFDVQKATRLEKRLEYYLGTTQRGGQQLGAIRDYYSKRDTTQQRSISGEIINPY